MLRLGLVHEIRNYLLVCGFSWEDFESIGAESTYTLTYMPLRKLCYFKVAASSSHGNVRVTTAPHKSGLRESMTLLKHSESGLLEEAKTWAGMLNSELKAHQVLKATAAHRDEVDELLALLEKEHGSLPEKPHDASEIPDVLTTLEELRKRLDAEIRARQEDERRTAELLGELNLRIDRLEKAVGFYSKRHVVRTVLSILVWFGKNAEDLKKLGQFVAGLLQ